MSKDKKKFGRPESRVLAIDDSAESKQTIEFLDRLGVAYTVQNWSQIKGSKLPNVAISGNGKRFEGLENIKYYMWALKPTIRECMEKPERADQIFEKFEKIWRDVKKELGIETK